MTATSGRFRTTGAVHVWHGRAGDRLLPLDAALLSDDELRLVRSRSGRQAAAAHYAGAHAAVRRILGGHYLGVPPEAVRFGRHACPRCGDLGHGRPRIVGPVTVLDFSLSRSGPYWLLAVTAGTRVGADIEQRTGIDRIIEDALTDDELARMLSTDPLEERQKLFYRAWTRKEAVLKACGVGVVADLRALDVSPAEAGPVTVEHTEPAVAGRWHVQDLGLPPGLSGALAQEAGSVRSVVLREQDGVSAAHGAGRA
ncbi:4'-phosphopantetheinyl transferase superfamily protein [Streptomyces sp. NPDC002994]|uniref:4'-phosphopantetheinyl transferase family protein n=1 Tax=Streptomyces sp. NPDC002994 TaxID=3154441 RepID=UPI0033AC4B2A